MVLHRRLGPLLFLVRAGKRIRFCHADHLLSLSATLLEQEPTLQPLDLASPSMKKLVQNDLPVPLSCSQNSGKEPGELNMEKARDKFEKSAVESGNEKPEMLNQLSEIPEHRYPVRSGKSILNFDL